MGVMIGKKHQRIEKFTAVFTVLAVLLVEIHGGVHCVGRVVGDCLLGLCCQAY